MWSRLTHGFIWQRSCPSTKYVTYYIRNVLGRVMHELSDDTVKFEILKSLAELSAFYMGSTGACTVADLDVLFACLLEYLPKPELSPTADTETKSDAAASEEQKFNFSYVECLLFAFHAIGRHHDTYLTAPDEAVKDRARDFRLRLQYFAKGTQNYIKELRNSLLSAASLANQENEEVSAVFFLLLSFNSLISILLK